jgi:hypothetical protein
MGDKTHQSVVVSDCTTLTAEWPPAFAWTVKSDIIC